VVVIVVVVVHVGVGVVVVHVGVGVVVVPDEGPPLTVKAASAIVIPGLLTTTSYTPPTTCEPERSNLAVIVVSVRPVIDP
jgi:hypothetical protein